MEQDINHAATPADAHWLWTELYFTPPYGRCARKDCGCLRFELTPDRFAPANPTCSGCSHHANFHALGSEADRTFGLRRRQMLLEVWFKGKNTPLTPNEAPLHGAFDVDGRKALSDFLMAQTAGNEKDEIQTLTCSPAMGRRPDSNDKEGSVTSDGKGHLKREAEHVHDDIATLGASHIMTQNAALSNKATHAIDDADKERPAPALDLREASLRSQQCLTGHTHEKTETPRIVFRDKAESGTCVGDITTKNHRLKAGQIIDQNIEPFASSTATLIPRNTQHINDAMENLNLRKSETQNRQVPLIGRFQQNNKHNLMNPGSTNTQKFTMQYQTANDQTFQREDMTELAQPDSRSRFQDTAQNEQAGEHDAAKVHITSSSSMEDSMFKSISPESHVIEPMTPEDSKMWHTSNNVDQVHAGDRTSIRPTAILHSFATGSSQPASGITPAAKESKPLFEVWLPGQAERCSLSSADGPVKYVPWWMEESSPSAETFPAETFPIETSPTETAPTKLQASPQDTEGSEYWRTTREQSHWDNDASAFNQSQRNFANPPYSQKQATKTLSRTEYYARYGIWPSETNAERGQRRKQSKMKSETEQKQVNSSSISRFSSQTRSVRSHVTRGRTNTASLKPNALYSKSPSDQSTTPSQQGSKETRRRAERRQRAKARAEAESMTKGKNFTSAESPRSRSISADTKTHHLDMFSEFEEAPLIDL